ncbi:unnamed protein product [Malus baccata var. baccata]
MVGSSSSGGDLRTPQFDGANYDFWAVKMETILIAHDLWDVVELGVQPQQPPEEEEGSVDEESEAEHTPLFPRIRNEKTAKGAWEILRREFRGDKKVRAVKLQAIRAEFEYLRMHDGEPLDDYLARFFEIVNNLKSLEETRDLDVIRVEEVLASVKVYDKREDLHDERDKVTGTERAFSSLKIGGSVHASTSGNYKGAQSKQNHKWQQNKKGRNWSQSNNWNGNGNSSWNNQNGGNWGNRSTFQSKQGSSSQGTMKPQCQTCDKYHFGICRYKGKPKCGKCGRFGHTAKDCNNDKQVANYAKEEGVTNDTMFYACHSATTSQDRSVWFVDSACSNHMTS